MHKKLEELFVEAKQALDFGNVHQSDRDFFIKIWNSALEVAIEEINPLELPDPDRAISALTNLKV